MAVAKKKWSIEKVKEKVDYVVFLDEKEKEKIKKEISGSKVITKNVLTERFKLESCFAAKLLKEFESEGLIVPVSCTRSLKIYTKA